MKLCGSTVLKSSDRQHFKVFPWCASTKRRRQQRRLWCGVARLPGKWHWRPWCRQSHRLLEEYRLWAGSDSSSDSLLATCRKCEGDVVGLELFHVVIVRVHIGEKYLFHYMLSIVCSRQIPDSLGKCWCGTKGFEWMWYYVDQCANGRSLSGLQTCAGWGRGGQWDASVCVGEVQPPAVHVVGRGRPDQGDAVRASKLLGQCTRYDSGERCGFRSGKAGVGGEPEPEEATWRLAVPWVWKQMGGRVHGSSNGVTGERHAMKISGYFATSVPWGIFSQAALCAEVFDPYPEGLPHGGEVSIGEFWGDGHWWDSLLVGWCVHVLQHEDCGGGANCWREASQTDPSCQCPAQQWGTSLGI